MAAGLRARGDASALDALDRSLRIIREREQRGYITEAMVQHRLRLLSLREDWGAPPLPPMALSREAAQERADRARLEWVETPTLRLQGRLLVHGDAIERVRGAAKRLRSTFRLWLRLENRATEPLQLSAPTLSAEPALPVHRWYREDTPGAPFDGRLEVGETVSLLVIGDAAAPIAPGTNIAATIRVGDATFARSAHAASHWTELLR